MSEIGIVAQFKRDEGMPNVYPWEGGRDTSRERLRLSPPLLTPANPCRPRWTPVDPIKTPPDPFKP